MEADCHNKTSDKPTCHQYNLKVQPHIICFIQKKKNVQYMISIKSGNKTGHNDWNLKSGYDFLSRLRHP